MNDVKFNNFYRYWQFENNILSKIKRLVRIYLKSILTYLNSYKLVNFNTMINFYNKCIELKENNK